MIEFTRAYVVNGATYGTLEEAQAAEIKEVLSKDENADKAVETVIVENADRIIDILTTKATSRPKARKSNGGTKQRKPKAAPAAPAQPELVPTPEQ